MKRLLLITLVIMFAATLSLASVIHIEAEDCILSGLAYDMGANVSIAHDGTLDGHFSAKGIGTMALPVAIPDGEYTVRIAWSLESWSHWMGQVAIQNLGSGSVVENGAGITGDGGDAGFHYFHTRTDASTYITGNYDMVDYLAGPGGMEFENPDHGNTMGTSITVSGVGAGELAISFNEPSSGGYDNFRIDWIELEAIPEPATLALMSLGLLVVKRRK